MRKIIIVTVLCFLAASTAAAANVTVSPNYDFTKVKTVLIMDPAFSYGGFDLSGNNKFVHYPDATDKITAMLIDQKRKMPHLQFVSLAYVIARIKADPALAADQPSSSEEFSALMQREVPKYADLALATEIRNFGWYYAWQEAYVTMQTRYDRVRYGGKTPDGKEYSGWMEVPRTVEIDHPAHHEISDSAEARFTLADTRTGRNVWQFSDTRTRSSFAWGKDYDPSGPESMMERIFTAAVEKMPLYSQEEN